MLAQLEKQSFLQKIAHFCSIYSNPQVLALIFLGFASAVPVPLMGATLTVWLAESGMSKTAIGFFAFFHLPFGFRIIWGPIIDRYTVPGFHLLGQRRGWAVLSLLLCMLSLALMGWVGPKSYVLFAVCTMLSGLFTGCLYMIGLAYEIESLDQKQYTAGSACVIVGYRLGLLFSGAGALYLANFYDWTTAYWVMAGSMVLGIFTVLYQPEPKKSALALKERQMNQEQIAAKIAANTPWKKCLAFFYSAIVYPIMELGKRPNLLMVIAFIIFYKLGDDIVDSVLGPFYLETGFSKADIANANKVMGMGATFLGAFAAGLIITKLDQLKSLFLFGLMHALSFLLYLWLVSAGKQMSVFYLAVAVEHITGGMMMAAFIAFLWSVCSSSYAALQYALLWSLISFKRTFFLSFGGWLADQMEWSTFFLSVMLFSLPGVLLCLGLNYKAVKQKENFATQSVEC